MADPPAGTDWNYADVWEQIADLRPEAPALRHGQAVRAWADFDRAADGVARWLSDLELKPHGVVALCMRNRPEYLEAMFACFKVGLVPSNSNFRYSQDELLALWAQAGAEVVVYDSASAASVEPLVGRADTVRAWLRVPDDTAEADDLRRRDDWRCSWPEIAGLGAPGRRFGASLRSGDDRYLLFTGGTTGQPKGVLWRQDDLFVLLNRTTKRPYDPFAGIAGLRRALQDRTEEPPRLVVAAPLMHGLGSLTAMSALACAGSVATLTGHSFSAAEFLDLALATRATQATIVGEAFARPLLERLEAEPGRWPLDSLRVLLSSGTRWTTATKRAIAGYLPKVRCVDVLGSSEAIDVASSVTSSAGPGPASGQFALGPDARVLGPDDRPVRAGSGMPGRLAVRGRAPLGYLSDPEASRRTFVERPGERWTVLGDWATVDADGTINLLGRGSSVVNTGGEKVFPDEVEDALRACPGVLDAVVVGVDHPYLGEEVAALVEARPGTVLDEVELRQRLRRALAGFKVPRMIWQVGSVGRAPNGKLDRTAIRAVAAEWARTRDTGPDPGSASTREYAGVESYDGQQ